MVRSVRFTRITKAFNTAERFESQAEEMGRVTERL